jgi:A/G-specific adenine glycosylase
MPKTTHTDTFALLLAWYEQHRRELPWRETRDPYRIWISEVILQQTRVAQGLDYYCRFIARFPDVRTLAEAPQDEVLRHWQGLGYYSRARNLHAAAQDMMTRFGGRFPNRYDDIRSLKGVGDYTAAAIASFAFDLPHAAVDGNVYRWLSRFYGIHTPIDSTEGKKAFAELASRFIDCCQPGIDSRRPGLWNQAAMEFGALQCTPKSPDCPSCPLSGRCRALAEGVVETLPVKSGKTTVKPRWFNYLVIRSNGHTLLARRTAKDIWQNLYEYPLIETPHPVDLSELQAAGAFQRLFAGASDPVLHRVTPMPPHVLSHRVIHAVFYEFLLPEFTPAMTGDYLILDDKELDNYAVPRLIDRYRASFPPASKKRWF